MPGLPETELRTRQGHTCNYTCARAHSTFHVSNQIHRFQRGIWWSIRKCLEDLYNLKICEDKCHSKLVTVIEGWWWAQFLSLNVLQLLACHYRKHFWPVKKYWQKILDKLNVTFKVDWMDWKFHLVPNTKVLFPLCMNLSTRQNLHLTTDQSRSRAVSWIMLLYSSRKVTQANPRPDLLQLFRSRSLFSKDQVFMMIWGI